MGTKRNQSPRPNEIVATATEKSLRFQYAELLRLRKAVQEAAAAHSATVVEARPVRFTQAASRRCTRLS